MIKKLIIVLVFLVSLIVLGLVTFDSGWILAPEFCRKSTRYKARAMRRALLSASLAFEQAGVIPPCNDVDMLEEESECWGTPIQYSFENKVSILRAAGKDRQLNTSDDITHKVCLPTQKSE